MGTTRKIPKEFFVLSDKLLLIEKGSDKDKEMEKTRKIPEFFAEDRLVIADNYEILDEKGNGIGFFVKKREDIAPYFAKQMYDKTFPLGARGYKGLPEIIRKEIFAENISKCEMSRQYKDSFDSYFSTRERQDIYVSIDTPVMYSSSQTIPVTNPAPIVMPAETLPAIDEANFGMYCINQFSLSKSKANADKSFYQVDIDGDGQRTDFVVFGKFTYQYNDQPYGASCNGSLLLFINNGNEKYQVERINQNNLCKVTFYKKGEVVQKKRFTNIVNKQGVQTERKEEVVPYVMPTDGFRLDYDNEQYFQVATFDNQSINQVKIIQGTEDVQKYGEEDDSDN